MAALEVSVYGVPQPAGSKVAGLSAERLGLVLIYALGAGKSVSYYRDDFGFRTYERYCRRMAELVKAA